ncbi:restriction endonuclease subunit S [Geomonas azotofigens]|uniref:restriction endonuclease subunit S n=1 Tax=Geomonas azotofigens TaxID=2843196 RepID=UPI001C110A1B|nr:restriction endonuclease subunit S [Geomonas azotofigens]MBU5611619.1 restriction endonuclease subunit S [Geomonas azotofigens]
MSIWPILPLGSKVKFLSGGTPRKDEPKYWNGNIPWVSSAEMVQRRINSTQLHVTEDGATNGSRLIAANTVLVVVRGMSLANEFRVAICRRDLTFNQDLKALVPLKGLDPTFLFYYLLSQNNAIRDSASEAAHGTKKLDMPVLEQWPLPFPPQPIQKKISAVLSAYDDLIENNKRRIALLEKMAEEIYREWFVRLRFPGHEAVKVVKGVPEGWDQKRFDEFCTLQRGYDLPDSQVEPGPYPVVASTSIKAFHNQFKVRPPVVTTGRSGSLGTVLFLAENAWPLNTCLYVKNFHGNSPYLVYYTLKNMGLENFNAGAGVPSLNRNHLGGIRLAVPAEPLQNQFDKIIAPIFQQKRLLQQAILTLEKTRDSLLPRLISGKVSVENLNIQFPPSMKDEATI